MSHRIEEMSTFEMHLNASKRRTLINIADNYFIPQTILKTV